MTLSARAAALAGTAASFVVAVDLLRAIRLGLLLDPEPSWALPRLLLCLGVLSAAVACGGAVAGAFSLWSRSPLASLGPEPLPFGRGMLCLLATGAILSGALLRFACLDRLPAALWIDDLSLIAPALSLEGSFQDFSDSIRAAPFGVEKPYGSVGVLYLEAYRLTLRLLGTTVLGVRFPSLLAGILSLVTAMLLGRALLPRGGGALAALILAGLRWHLILSRWGWQAIVIAPIVDAAGLLLLSARRSQRPAASAAAGLLLGLGTHVYLSAWIAAFALLLFAFSRGDPSPQKRRNFRLPLFFLVSFLLVAAPLFLFRKGRVFPYFVRAADHNVVLEIERSRSWMPPLAAAADAITAPWFTGDPVPRNDLPGRSRLGWILGLPVALALARSLISPRQELSAFLLAHAAAAFAASVLGGQADHPNGYRFAYLTTATAVAAAGGTLWILRLAPLPYRRVAAISAVGLLAIGGALGARDALTRWAESRGTFDGFYGQDTLVARAALRWESFGPVEVDPALGHSPRTHSPLTIRAIRRYRLDPDRPRHDEDSSLSGAGIAPKCFRIALPGAVPEARERVVELVRDLWGREWGVVLGRKTCSSIAGEAGLALPHDPLALQVTPLAQPRNSVLSVLTASSRGTGDLQILFRRCLAVP